MIHNPAFFGTWELEPSSCQYAVGQPPQEGRYQIHAANDELRFVISWKDSGGHPNQMEFTALPDGQRHPFQNPALADAMQFGYKNTTILESWSFKDEKILGYTKREIINMGTKMIVTQEVETPTSKLINRATYKKL